MRYRSLIEVSSNTYQYIELEGSFRALAMYASILLLTPGYIV